MKILVICQHYWPENFRVTEICEELAARGHQVTALVGRPNYPDGKIPPEYLHGQNRLQHRNGVEIRRVREIGRRPGKVGLAINYVSYMLPACFQALRMGRKYDAVYAFSTSPVLMSVPAALVRAVLGKKFLLYVLDIWPACLAAMNVYEGSFLYAVMKKVSRWVYRRADILVYSSHRFREYLQTVHQLEVPEEYYLPQFADDIFDRELPNVSPHEGVQFVFAGNIGKMQSVQCLIRAAALLGEKPITWHIVGDGSDLEECKALAHSLELGDTVRFYGRRPLEEMPAFYAMADALLVSMKSDISVNDTLPGKVQSYMAAGKPVLGAIAGEAAYVISDAGCGFCAEPDNPEAFRDAVLAFLKEKHPEEMGQRGREYYLRRFTKKRHMDTLEGLLKSLVGE